MSERALQPAALVVTTDRLLLRPLRENDRAEFIRVHALSLEFLRPWVPARFATDAPEEVFAGELARTAAAVSTGAARRYAAELRSPAGLPTGTIVGYFNLNNIVRGVFQNADASWQLAADATGRGLATEAVGAMLDAAFAAPPLGLGLHRVQANVIPENAPSVALAQRCGFRREGLARAMLKIAGHWRDHIMYAKLADEHTPTGAALGRDAG